MIDLYALTSPNVQKIYLMLEETKLPYKEHFVDVWKGEQYNADFIKINPNSKIPAIVDSDGPGGKPITIFESGAILIYLAEKTGRFMPKDAAARYNVLQWLFFRPRASARCSASSPTSRCSRPRGPITRIRWIVIRPR